MRPTGKKKTLKADLVLLAMGFLKPELPSLPDRVMQAGLVKDGGLFVLEHGKTHDFSQHPRFVEHRAYGSVNFSFFRQPEAQETTNP